MVGIKVELEGRLEVYVDVQWAGWNGKLNSMER